MNYFSFFLSYFESAEDLTDEEFGRYVRALCGYAFHGREDDSLKGVAKALYRMAVPIIDKKKETPKGGRPKLLADEDVAKIAEKSMGGVSQTELAREFGVSQKTISNVMFRLANSGDCSENAGKSPAKTDGTGTDGEREEDKGGEEEKGKRFKPPTLDEVRRYCQDRKNRVDWRKFYDYYNENRWRDNNGNPVKNWKGKMIAVWEPKSRDSASKLDGRDGLDGISDDFPF